ncbi:hypothetical protein [Aliikangiella sp. G2MR2-5]|uniref:hypothetical protein n=1 Tax=Aliikangiella sp. G2MR2-5 TaxID=2788943 RepID=UPI0018AA19BE|nr:hypothetical protein [Aliikangiella sp. G2MR2-5]
MLKLSDFFGLSIDEDVSDIRPLLEALSINKEIEKTKVVTSLKKKNGTDAAIVNVGRRQQVLKLIQPLVNSDMLDYEANYYDKEINTSSDHDRRYGAEDKLLMFSIIVASTKSLKIARDDTNLPTIKLLREAKFKETRFDRLWDVLSDETSHIVSAYRKSKK